MPPLQFDAQVMEKSGYGYLIIPQDLLDSPQDVWVRLMINDLPHVAKTVRRLNGEHEVQLNREAMYDLGLKPGQRLSLTMERLEAPPQLNDLPADFLAALIAPAMEENYKRLPPETQRKYLEKVEKAENPNRRAETIREIVGEIQARAGDLPRGESL